MAHQNVLQRQPSVVVKAFLAVTGEPRSDDLRAPFSLGLWASITQNIVYDSLRFQQSKETPVEGPKAMVVSKELGPSDGTRQTIQGNAFLAWGPYCRGVKRPARGSAQ